MSLGSMDPIVVLIAPVLKTVLGLYLPLLRHCLEDIGIAAKIITNYSLHRTNKNQTTFKPTKFEILNELKATRIHAVLAKKSGIVQSLF